MVGFDVVRGIQSLQKTIRVVDYLPVRSVAPCSADEAAIIDMVNLDLPDIESRWISTVSVKVLSHLRAVRVYI